MKFSFKSLLGTVTRGARTIREVVAAGVPVKKEERQNLSTSDELKLVKTSKEGGTCKFTFFDPDGQTRGYFRVVHDLFMRIEFLSKATSFHDMCNVFKMIHREMTTLLESKLDDFFNSQSILNDTCDVLTMDPSNYSFTERLKEAIERR